MKKRVTYYKTQIERAISIRDDLTGDPGQGLYFNIPRQFVLKEPTRNIFPAFRQQAISYFQENKIGFWRSGEKRPPKVNLPSGHMLSSQVSCVNHLFALYSSETMATAVLHGLDDSIVRAIRFFKDPNDCGFVSFEVIGLENYLRERSHTRGANSTSIDAAMIGENKLGQRKIFLFEWKYVEEYRGQPSKLKGNSGNTRKSTYMPLLQAQDCPLNFDFDNPNFLRGLFYEPFYQMARQALLANEMVKNLDFGAKDYLHIHVIPNSNSELKDFNTSRNVFPGKDLHSAWGLILKANEKYKAIDPRELLNPVVGFPEAKAIIDYLEKRYW